MDRVKNNIQLFWGTFEGYEYLEKLILMEPDRDRQGFPPEFMQMLMKAYEVHEWLYEFNQRQDPTK